MKKNLKIIQFIFILVCCTVLYSKSPQKEPLITARPFTVVLDAGHGGHDSGTRGNGYREKDIALDIVLQIGNQLEKNSSIKVLYTRKKDVFIPLNKRAEFANKAKADLFVSIHCNAHKTTVSGTETFVLGLHANQRNFEIAKKENAVILLEDNYKSKYDGFDPGKPESIIGLTLMQEAYLDKSLSVASLVQENFKEQLNRVDRGVKQAGFLVLHQTFMPSVLIETGFLTHKKEGKYLNSWKGKQEISKSIAKSIVQYMDNIYTTTVDKSTKSTTPPQDNKRASSTKNHSVSKPKEVVKKAPIKHEIEKEVSNASQEIVFKVQLFVVSKEISKSSKLFKGLSPISKIKRKSGVYKYYYGETSCYQSAKNNQKQARKKGFKSAYIVAFKNNKAIPLTTALKKL